MMLADTTRGIWFGATVSRTSYTDHFHANVGGVPCAFDVICGEVKIDNWQRPGIYGEKPDGATAFLFDPQPYKPSIWARFCGLF